MLLHGFSHQEFINAIGVMLVGLDTLGRINLINSAGAEFLGFTREKLTGKNWFDHFLLPEDRRSAYAVFSQAMEGKAGTAWLPGRDHCYRPVVSNVWLAGIKPCSKRAAAQTPVF